MATLILFLIGVVSLFLFDPNLTAFYYNNPINLAWFLRIITSMVSHGNAFHLLGNFAFGLPFMLYAEHRLKSHRAFFKLFFYTGLAALLGQRLFDMLGETPAPAVIGSSGAIFGIIAFALTIANESKPIRFLSIVMLLFHLANQLMWTLFSIKGLAFGVAFGAHLSGMIAGIAIAIILRRRLRRHPPKGRQRQSRSQK